MSAPLGINCRPNKRLKSAPGRLKQTKERLRSTDLQWYKALVSSFLQFFGGTMAKLHLTLSCGTYDRTWALAHGEVQPEGIELNYISPNAPSVTFWRMLKYREFDVAELSLANYTILRLIRVGSSKLRSDPDQPICNGIRR